MDVEILVEEFEVAVEFPFMDRLCCFSGSYSKVRMFVCLGFFFFKLHVSISLSLIPITMFCVVKRLTNKLKRHSL